MTKKNPTSINLSSCNNIYEVIEIMKNVGDGVLFDIDYKLVNTVMYGYGEAIKIVRCKLEAIGQPELITKELYDEANRRFESIMCNVGEQVYKGEMYADNVAYLISFLVYTAKMIESYGMKLEAEPVEYY